MRKLIKDAALYVVGAFISGIVPLLFLPVYSKFLDATELGKFSLFLVLVSLSNVFCGLSLHGACVRKYFDCSDFSSGQDNELSRFISASFFLLFSSVSIFLLISLSVDVQYFSDFGVDKEILTLAIIYSFFKYIYLIFIGQLQARRVISKFIWHKSLFVVMENMLSLTFVLYISSSFESRLQGFMISGILYSLLSLFFLYRMKLISFELKRSCFSECLRFGLPLLPHTFGMFLLNNIDKLLLTKYYSAYELGIYYVAFSLSAPLGVLGETLNRAFVPHLYSVYSLGKAKSLQVCNMMLLFSIAIMVIGGGYYIFILNIFDFMFDAEFSPAKDFLWVLFLAQVFRCFYLVLSSYVTFSKRTYSQSVSTIMSFVFVFISFVILGFPTYQHIAYYFCGGLLVQFSIMLMFTFFFVERDSVKNNLGV